ncbi:MAG TPA: CrcB family protein [Acidimicrobiia bacterium]|nr:CrcB family protein [Acidimicrobiia bacterium]
MRFIWIGVLGSVGALARYELSRALHQRTERGGLPTMVVNLIGAILLGALVGVDARSPIEPDLMAALTVGFLGGFTTFSTWMGDVVILAEDGQRGRRRAALNLVITLVGGIAGYAFSQMLLGLSV